MHGRQRRRRRSLGFYIIAVVWSTALLAAAVLLGRQGENAARLASVLGALTALAAFSLSQADRVAARVSGKKERGAGADVSDLDRAAGELAAAVRDAWNAEARMRRLQDPWPLPLHWVAADEDLADHASVVFRPRSTAKAPGGPMGPVHFSGHLAEVVEAFEQLPNRRLVVLGTPGSGKSVLVMKLALDILYRWQPGAPVPVIFPVSSWDPSRARMREWLVDYLTENYEFGSGGDEDSRAIARRLVAGNMLLPVLDGLDEMPPALHVRAIKNLNREIDAAQPFILTCRTDEYRKAVEAGDVLTLAAAVEIQPLALSAVIEYLTETTPAGKRGSQWVPVFDKLKEEPTGPLATVLRIPLMVALARTIYGDSPGNPSKLLESEFRDPAVIEEHLLDKLISATYGEHLARQAEPSDGWQVEEVTSWLTYLAQHLGRLGKPDLAWWQLERAVPRAVMDGISGVLGGLVLAFIFGPLVGAAFAVAMVLARTSTRSRPWTVEALLEGRLESWIRHVIIRSRKPDIVTAITGLGKKVSVERRFGLALGRIAAIVAGLIQGLIVYQNGNLFPAIASGLGVGLAVGLGAGYFTVSLRTTPSEVQFAAKKGADLFVRQLAIGFAIGVGTGVAFGALVGSRFGVLTGILIGASFGIIDGLNVWLDVPTDVTRAFSPRSSRRAERVAALARSVTVALTLAATTALAYGVAYGTRSHKVGTRLWYRLRLGRSIHGPWGDRLGSLPYSQDLAGPRQTAALAAYDIP